MKNNCITCEQSHESNERWLEMRVCVGYYRFILLVQLKIKFVAAKAVLATSSSLDSFSYFRINTFSSKAPIFILLSICFHFFLLQGYTISCCMFMYTSFVGLGLHRINIFSFFLSSLFLRSAFISVQVQLFIVSEWNGKISLNILAESW